MPLAGLILNRTHPNLTAIGGSTAEAAANNVDDPLTKAVLTIHSERATTGKRELHLLHSFTTSHPAVPIVGVPSLPFEVADMTALRAVAEEITSKG